MSNTKRSITVAVLASGSRGNATYVGDGEVGVLVDCGVSTRQIMERMKQVGLGGWPVDAVLITHEHRDHVISAGVLSRRLIREGRGVVPFHMTAGTAGGLPPAAVPDLIEPIAAGGVFHIGHLRVESFSISHDTADPVGFRLEIGGVRVGFATDLGHSTALVEHRLRDVDVAILEFNHDIEMLLTGSYPWGLKQRIHGSHGHLSNEQASGVLRTMGEGLSHLVLAHLSEENNLPERAYAAATRTLREQGREGAVQVVVAEQDRPLPPIRLPAG